MNYLINISRSAQKDLSKLPIREYDKIIKEIQLLSTNPRPNGCIKLSGRDGWRIRIGNYRVIYDIQDLKLVVLIIEVGHRKEIYK